MGVKKKKPSEPAKVVEVVTRTPKGRASTRLVAIEPRGAARQREPEAKPLSWKLGDGKS